LIIKTTTLAYNHFLAILIATGSHALAAPVRPRAIRLVMERLDAVCVASKQLEKGVETRSSFL
jgi:hypothetical protein